MPSRARAGADDAVSFAELDPEQLERHQRAFDLASDLTDAGYAYLGALEDVEHAAAELAGLDGQYRAALQAAALIDRRPVARELAAEAALCALRSLRPYISATSEAAGRRAAECLTSEPPMDNPAEDESALEDF